MKKRVLFNIQGKNTDELEVVYDVIIVGAGISGIAAASKLKEFNPDMKVLILEANQQVGGRILTERLNHGTPPFNVGSVFIYGGNTNPIKDILPDETQAFDTFNTKIYDHEGQPISEKKESEEYESFVNFLEDIQIKASISDSIQSMITRFKKSKENDKLWQYFLAELPGPPAKLSARYFQDDAIFRGGPQLIHQGYDVLIKHLITTQNLDVKVNTMVTQIDITFSGNDELSTEKKFNVCVTTQLNEKLRAKYVIVTASLNMLKRNVIKFIPSLPLAKQQALADLDMHTINNYQITFHKTFWDDSLTSFGYCLGQVGYFNVFINLNKTHPQSHTLLTFCHDQTLEHASDTEVLMIILSHLQKIFPKEQQLALLSCVKNFQRSYWSQHPFIYGSYSYPTINTKTDVFDTLAHPIGRYLLFAGEHTSKDFRGTVHGAYLSGIREAQRIIFSS